MLKQLFKKLQKVPISIDELKKIKKKWFLWWGNFEKNA